MAITDLQPAPTTELNGRDRILNAAASLFLSRGYAETSLRTIADAVDMRPASIYHHFASKDALLTEILRIGMVAVTTAFEETSENLAPDADGRDRLRGHVAGHLSALFTNHAFTAAHVTVFPFAPGDVRRAAVPERDAYESQWTTLLADVAPHLSPDASRLVRLVVFGAMNSSLQWFDPSEGSVDDLATTIVSTLWDGLGGRL
jgi:AcrR family transcriptional regulator